MDIGTIISTGIGIALGVAPVAALAIKYAIKASKYVKLAKDATTVLADAVEALQDGKLSPEEITLLTADVNRFRINLKS
jgi:hypothetical protein